MPARITNKRQVVQPLPIPISLALQPNQVRDFLYVEYDKLMNDRRFVELIDKDYIKIEPLEAIAASFVSEWDKEPKLRLGTYVFWVDALAQLRMKPSDPTFDLDGVVIGPGGGITPHGSTHTFFGTDPVPNIEVLEGQWVCPTTVAVRDAVYQVSPGNVDKANATTTSTMPVIGVVLSKPTTTSCIIARSGELSGFSGLTGDRLYYASDAVPGGVTLIPPIGANRVVQQVGYSRNSSTLIVELGEMKKRA